MSSGLATAALAIGREFQIGGTTWTLTRADAAGVVQTIGTIGPLYIVQEQPSRLERALAESAAALRSRWALIATTDDAQELTNGDTLTSIEDAALTFLVSGIDRDETPGLCQATLEKQPFT